MTKMTKITKYGRHENLEIQKITIIASILALSLIACSVNSIPTVKAASPTIFDDGIESGNFNAWNQVFEYSGGSIQAVTNQKVSGNYGTRFTTDRYSSYGQLHLTKNINPKSELYARVFINIDSNGLRDSQDKLYFIRFTAGNDNVLYAGWRISGSNIHWQLLIRDGSSYVSQYSDSIPNTDQWYSLEVYWQKSINGGAKLWVNGNEEININNKDTNNFGDVTRVRFGVAEAYQIDSTTLYADNFAISDSYIGTTQSSPTQSSPTSSTSTPPSTPSNNLQDGFESNSISQWDGIETTSQETVTIESYDPYQGNYHARFFTSGSTGEENAYLYQNIDQAQVYAKGYFKIHGLPLNDQNDRFYLIELDANDQPLAGIGIREHNNQLKWATYARDGSGWVWPTYLENPAIASDRWYQVELEWQKNSRQGYLKISIDGQVIFNIENIDTDNYGNVDEIRMGQIYTYSVQDELIVYGDNFETSAETTTGNTEDVSTSNEPPAQEQTNSWQPTNQIASGTFNGLSGYPTSTSQIDQILREMNQYDLNTYRMSFSPEWNVYSRHAYRESLVQHFLDNSDFTVIIDRNHLYPPGSSSDQQARNNWQTLKSSIFEVLRTWPNNQRVMVEIVNEYSSSDFYSRMQNLIYEIRQAGYTNPIVINKFSQQWQQIDDPIDNTYQGYHFYFNSWSLSGAIGQMETALSRGMKIINTEVGADFDGYRSFSSSEVRELNEFIQWCTNRGIGNTVWVNENLMNWQRYEELNVDFP
jgi:hypothetical protein